MAAAMQAAQSSVVPVAPQGSSQAGPIAGISLLNWSMSKLTKLCSGSLSVLSAAVSVSVNSVLSLSTSVLRLLARAGGVS